MVGRGRRAGRLGPAVTALSFTLAAGCGPAEVAAPSEPAPAPAPEQAPDQAPEATPGPDLPRDPPVDAGRPPNACDASTASAITATVSTQLDAFADDDIAGAYAVTSPFFRRFLDETGFATLIRDEYPELLGNDGHRADECLAVGRRGSLIVGVRSGTREVVLRYDLSEEGDGWRIDGARRLVGVQLPPQPLA